jgi:hypothetical protein
MPFAFEEIALRSQVTDNSADFMGRKSRIDRDREVMQPELGLEITGADIDMRRLATEALVSKEVMRLRAAIPSALRHREPRSGSQSAAQSRSA